MNCVRFFFRMASRLYLFQYVCSNLIFSLSAPLDIAAWSLASVSGPPNDADFASVYCVLNSCGLLFTSGTSASVASGGDGA